MGSIGIQRGVGALSMWQRADIMRRDVRKILGGLKVKYNDILYGYCGEMCAIIKCHGY